MASVYSVRFFSEVNVSGSFLYTNNTGDVGIIRTFAAFYGGSVPPISSIALGLNGGAHWIGGGFDTVAGNNWLLFTELRLVFLPGETILVQTDNGTDFSAHGYYLSTP